MSLIEKADSLPFEPRSLADGAGAFLAAGGHGREVKRIAVHYYKPTTFTADRPILIVIPGAGRNANDYRDVWIAEAEKSGVLIAALGYPERDYDFAAYQMGGVVRNLVIRNVRPNADGSPPSVLYLKDEDISFELNAGAENWLFADFDRIFGLLAAATGSRQPHYDLFGHSAGAQVLHRLALFRPASRAHRIVAANGGFYTYPTLDVPLPLGLKGTGVTRKMLVQALATRLIVLLGENDNDGEEGGIQIHTPLIDKQGVDRVARGRAFVDAGSHQAKAMAVAFGWRLEIVPNVGHDYRRMSEAAARLLYSEGSEFRL